MWFNIKYNTLNPKYFHKTPTLLFGSVTVQEEMTHGEKIMKSQILVMGPRSILAMYNLTIVT